MNGTSSSRFAKYTEAGTEEWKKLSHLRDRYQSVWLKYWVSRLFDRPHLIFNKPPGLFTIYDFSHINK